MPHNNAKPAALDKNLENNLRANHFALSHNENPDPLHFKTMNQNNF